MAKIQQFGLPSGKFIMGLVTRFDDGYVGVYQPMEMKFSIGDVPLKHPDGRTQYDEYGNPKVERTHKVSFEPYMFWNLTEDRRFWDFFIQPESIADAPDWLIDGYNVTLEKSCGPTCNVQKEYREEKEDRNGRSESADVEDSQV
jgi:hypothetical protein